MSEILEGAEPQSWSGGPHGVLVLHGFTGSPQSMRPLAQAFADAGYTVELPLLPGHGTTVEDMLGTDWADWSAAVEAAYVELAARCDQIVVAGLSMGGTLTVWLAVKHPNIAGIVLVNAAVLPQPEIAAILTPMLEAGETTFAGIGNDIAKEGVTELAYALTPLAPLASLGAAIDDLQSQLSSVVMPVLILNSPQDHVVPPASSDHIAATVSGPVERVTLEHSFHVATLDIDAQLVQAESLAFAARCFA